MAVNEVLKKAIEEIKIRFGLNQAEISEKLGVKSTYLSDMINCRVPLTESISSKLYEIFQISIASTVEEKATCNFCTEKDRRLIEKDQLIASLYSQIRIQEEMIAMLKEKLGETGLRKASSE